MAGLVKDPDRDPEMITNLLTFRALVDDILAKAFTGTAELNYEFTTAVKDAFRSGLSERKNKPAEMLGTDSHPSMRDCGAYGAVHQRNI